MSLASRQNGPGRAGVSRRPLWVILLGLSLVWVFVGAFFTLQVVLLDGFPVSVALRFAVMDWAPWILLSPLILWFARRVEISGRSWWWAIPAHIVASVVVAACVELQAPLWMPAREHRPPSGREWRGTPPPPPEDGQPHAPAPGLRGERPVSLSPFQLHRARLTIPVYCVLVAAAHALAHYRRSRERERRALEAEARLAEARFSALQAQINPHFLFNTLNAIAQCVHEDPRAAERMIESLGEMMRGILAASERREVPLAEELAMTDHYLAIQQLRFQDRMTIRREIEPGALEARVPTLVLQPLVENAVVHGIARSRQPGVIALRGRVSQGRLLLSVTDSGSGETGGVAGEPVAALREGIGLSNTRQRLRACFGEEASLALRHASGGGVEALVDVPLRKGPAA